MQVYLYMGVDGDQRNGRWWRGVFGKMPGTVSGVETELDGGKFRGPGTGTWVSTLDHGLASSKPGEGSQ